LSRSGCSESKQKSSPLSQRHRLFTVGIRQTPKRLGRTGYFTSDCTARVSVCVHGKAAFCLIFFLGFWSTLVGCAVGQVPVPENLTVNSLNSRLVELNWNAPSTGASSKIAGYHVYRDSSPVPVARVPVTMFRDAVLPGSQHRYEIRTVDAAGRESKGAISQGIETVKAATPPFPPSDVVAVAGDTKAVVGWVAPNDGGEAIQSYSVAANPGAISVTVPGNVTSAALTGLRNGLSYRFTVFATNNVGSGPTSAPSAATEPKRQPPRFPVSVSADRRYLRDRLGTPFPILGRTAWFITALSQVERETFITDTLARGYNAIEMYVINHDPRGRHPPFAGNGELPFLLRLDGSSWEGELDYEDILRQAPDVTTPNPVYWSYVDTLLDYCNSNGILVLFFPAYVGYQGGEMGWMQEMVANGISRNRAYGAWLASRYANRANIVWMMGGDYGKHFSKEEQDVERGLLDGLRSVADQQSIHFSAEWESESIATDQVALGQFMTLNSVYSWTGRVATHGRFAYEHRPRRPAFLMEEPYDEEGPDGNKTNPSATQPVRRFQWWGYLTTFGGYVSGNGYVWPFSDPAWIDHLDTQGSRDMSRLNAFVKSIRWWELVPSGLDGMKVLVRGNPRRADDPRYVAAAASRSGALLVAYIPPDHVGDVTVDMTALRRRVRARWVNPAGGSTVDIGTFESQGTRSFKTPGNNGSGHADWVLVLEAQRE